VRRCFDVGRALRRAIESWDSESRVVVIASGGLSHRLLDEDFDHAVLTALRDKQAHDLTSLPEMLFDSEGTSETKSWIALGGAVERLDMRLVDYVPCYRTLAGTGVGAAYAVWS
jgi:hypothetical protein